MKPSVAVQEKKSTVQKPDNIQPTLFWPSYDLKEDIFVDKRSIPKYFQIEHRYFNWDNFSGLKGSPEFINAICGAAEILIADPHLDRENSEALFKLFEESSTLLTIKILTGRNDRQEVKGHFDSFVKRHYEEKKQVDFELRQGLNKKNAGFLHDRLVCIDGELWHFGATVGGLHKGLNAFSRGWDGGEHEFSDWFKTTWERVSV